MSECNNGKGAGVSETLRNYQGGVWPILTLHYRGGEGGSKIRKTALRNLWTAPKLNPINLPDME